MIIVGHDQVVASWAQAKFQGPNFYAMHSAVGLADPSGTLTGAALFSDYYPGGNVELTYYGPGTISRAVIRAVIYYAFVTLGVSRITAKTRATNKPAIQVLNRLGCDFDCVMKRYYGPRKGEDDAVVYAFPVEKASKWMKVN